jgi:hypothetical protein
MGRHMDQAAGRHHGSVPCPQSLVGGVWGSIRGNGRNAGEGTVARSVAVLLLALSVIPSFSALGMVREMA